jgi:prephenate dehydratase
MRVAYQGEPGAYSEQALFEYFGEVEPVPRETFDAVFESVAAGDCDAGMIPVENSITGSIPQTHDLLSRHALNIIGEYVLRVRHCLISMPGVTIPEIKKATSHPQALAQCAQYLRSRGIQAEPSYDTAGSVKMLKDSGARDTAAIASRRAAELYGMQILEESIEDDPQNYTRFLAIAKASIIPNNQSKDAP